MFPMDYVHEGMHASYISADIHFYLCLSKHTKLFTLITDKIIIDTSCTIIELILSLGIVALMA